MKTECKQPLFWGLLLFYWDLQYSIIKLSLKFFNLITKYWKKPPKKPIWRNSIGFTVFLSCQRLQDTKQRGYKQRRNRTVGFLWVTILFFYFPGPMKLYWCRWINNLRWEEMICLLVRKKVFVSKESTKTFVCHLILEADKKQVQ